MDETFDQEKIADCMFDPVTSLIIAKLEGGEIESSALSLQTDLAESEILDRLSYLIEHGFIFKKTLDGKCMLAANFEKLDSIIENSNNFDTAINGIEKMDSYLN